MKKKLFKSTVSISLAAVLTLMSACGSSESTTSSSAQSDSSQTSSTSEASADPSAKPPVYSDKVAFSDRGTDSFNEAAFDARCQEFSELSQTGGNEDELNSLYDEIVDWLDCLNTDQSIAYFKYNLDVTDTDAATLYSSLQTLYTDKLNTAYTLFRDLVNSDTYHDSFSSYIGEELAKSLSEYKEADDELMTLSAKTTEIAQSYNELLVQDIDDESVQKQMKELYIDLVNTNNEIAEWYGYDNYADFAFYGYARDYTDEQLDSIKDSVKNNVLSLYNAYDDWAAKDGCISDAFGDYTISEDDLKKIPDLLENIDSSLSDSFNYLLDEGLYDIELSDTKTGSMFTMPLYSYKDACILFAPTGFPSNLTAVIHEFGHFNNFCSADYDALHTSSAVDVFEISSQSLELLFSKYYPDLNSEYGEALQQYTYHTILYSILSAFMVNDAESEAYRTEDLTVEKLDEIWNNAISKYGMDETYGNNAWLQIGHIFSTPCYYIGYGTSAIAALEIYNLSLSDWDKAVDCYMQICTMQPGYGVCETVEAAGLTDLFDSENLKNLCDTLADNWNVTDAYNSYLNSSDSSSEESA